MPRHRAHIRRGAAILAAAALVGTGCSLRPIDLTGERPLAVRTSIRAADGSLIARLFHENRELTSIDAMPQVLIDAVLAAEDARFFQHSGYDLKAIARAVVVNWREGKTLQGGSTITQQYVKNTYFRNPQRTIERKLRELRLAIEVERLYSKRDILERYLNVVYLGNGAYGVRAASETYFGHEVTSLSLPEAALLAALIRAPSDYDPLTHRRAARERRNYVIRRMATLGKIEGDEVRPALRAPLGTVSKLPGPKTRYPYFVEAVKRQVLTDERLGFTEAERARALWRGGLGVETTLVPRMQSAAGRAVRGVLTEPGDPEAALVAIRPKTGEIVAMVGGRNWKTSQVNLAVGKQGGGSGRQPGSAFKPLVAATALESGIPLTSRYESSPASFSLSDGSTWNVANAEGGGSGLRPLDEALVHSVNGVYARLALQLGAGQIATQARLMGVRSRVPAYPSIALGSAEVSVVDMAAAYATLANGGRSIQPTTIKEVELPDGEVLAPDQEVVEQAVSPGTAYLVTKVLEQVIERGTGTAADIGRPAAGKTGTTNDHADAWFVGYTPELVAAVWVGYPQGRIPMTSVHGGTVFGGTLPAQIWRAFMLEALRNTPVSVFRPPAGELVTVQIDPRSGLLAAPWCPGNTVRMLRQLVPTDYCPPPPPPPPLTGTPSPQPTRDEADGEGGGRDPSPSPSPKPSKKAPKPEPEPSPTKS